MPDFITNYSGISFIIGFLMYAWAHDRSNLHRRLLEKGTKTTGRVVKLTEAPIPLFGGKRKEGFAPVVEYTTISGNTLTHISTHYEYPSPYQPGQEVSLWYRNYKSIREATLEDEKPSESLKTYKTVALILIILSLLLMWPRILRFF
jgi:hypothetical protein